MSTGFKYAVLPHLENMSALNPPISMCLLHDPPNTGEEGVLGYSGKDSRTTKPVAGLVTLRATSSGCF